MIEIPTSQTNDILAGREIKRDGSRVKRGLVSGKPELF